MFLSYDIVDIEKPDGVYLLTFVVFEFSVLCLYSSIFSFKNSRSSYITNRALSDF